MKVKRIVFYIIIVEVVNLITNGDWGIRMSQPDSISIPDENLSEWRAIKDACLKNGVNFSALCFRGVKNEFVNGGWAKLMKKKK